MADNFVTDDGDPLDTLTEIQVALTTQTQLALISVGLVTCEEAAATLRAMARELRESPFKARTMALHVAEQLELQATALDDGFERGLSGIPSFKH